MQSPIIPSVGALIRSCPGTISLGQGVVHYPPPPEALAALSTFLEEPENHKYGPVDGIPALRAAIVEKLERENGVREGSGRRVIVTAGGNMAFLNAVLAILDAGEEVILPLPYYFNHEMAVTMVGGRPITVPTDRDYQLDTAAIRRAITPATRAIVTVSPNNPTGAVYSEEALREVNEICREAGLYHISDEAYEYFTYGDASHFSPGSIRGSEGHTISLYSLSKAYGFASWRIGYMVVPEALAGPIGKIQDTNVICPPVISQHAAVGALQAGAGYCREKVNDIAATRALVLGELANIADICAVSPADGALYFVLKIRTPLTSMEVVERLVREHGVAVIPGTTFGLEEGCRLRLSYGALDAGTVAAGMGRLVSGLRAIADDTD